MITVQTFNNLNVLRATENLADKTRLVAVPQNVGGKFTVVRHEDTLCTMTATPLGGRIEIYWSANFDTFTEIKNPDLRGNEI